MYKIQLDKNGTILKKVFISLPKGVFDLKAVNFSGTMNIDSDAYIYAMKHGLRDLLRNEIVKITVMPVKSFGNKQLRKVSAVKASKKSVINEPAKEAKADQVVSKDEPVTEEIPVVEEPVEVHSEQAIESAEVVEEVSEQPKKKSKKKK